MIAEYEFGGGSAQGTGRRYYEPDRLSTRVITNGSGAVVGTLDQLPFGEEVGAAGESEKHKFTSYERDSETGTDYAVNRQYQNTLGRFMRPDPYGGSMSITDPQSFNRYTYVGNDPVNSIDPLGLQQDPPLVIDVEDPPPAPQQPIESNDTLVVNTNEPGFFFFFPGFIDRPLLAFVRIDIVIGGFVDADGGGFFTPPVPLVPEPQNTEPDVVKHISREFECNKSASDLLQKLRQNFGQFANYVGPAGPGGISTATVTFVGGTITSGQTINIPHSVIVATNVVSFSTSVTVSSVSATGFTFNTNQGHPLYPGSITFSVQDTGQGRIGFSIDVTAHIANAFYKGMFKLGGSSFEGDVWNHLIDNIQGACGSLK